MARKMHTSRTRLYVPAMGTLLCLSLWLFAAGKGICGPKASSELKLKEIPFKIVYESYRGKDWDLFVMKADGSGFSNLTNNHAVDVNAAWSPDGTRIAFASERHYPGDIYVVNADGSGLTRLTDHPARESSPAWSPAQ